MILKELDTVISMCKKGSDFHDTLTAFRAEYLSLKAERDALRALLVKAQRQIYSDTALYDAIEAALREGGK